MSDSTIESVSEDESLTIQWATTLEEEDMPPDLEEEEGEEGEGEDEKEEADLDVIAESRQREPNTDDADSKEESNPKQKQKRKRADPTTQVTCEDGKIWIGNLAGSTQEGLQSLS
ncbi:hypothetical protein PAXRUDRAFT_19430 [Paxillus rubicundulus Ve08.2h10]|uniref:Uncharacterized protein n=1 Tax=Paxillus rubicundulus Ve08.2h10 TaxID=930991 RepID=A0A0D0D4L2_9AGAM|nr:hypothetical protein PAXRUDRAFT_19430 [Paxillus rubicundulus Ve08.2h10]